MYSSAFSSEIYFFKAFKKSLFTFFISLAKSGFLSSDAVIIFSWSSAIFFCLSACNNWISAFWFSVNWLSSKKFHKNHNAHTWNSRFSQLHHFTFFHFFSDFFSVFLRSVTLIWVAELSRFNGRSFKAFQLQKSVAYWWCLCCHLLWGVDAANTQKVETATHVNQITATTIFLVIFIFIFYKG